jgi:hypothetical protein
MGWSVDKIEAMSSRRREHEESLFVLSGAREPLIIPDRRR